MDASVALVAVGFVCYAVGGLFRQSRQERHIERLHGWMQDFDRNDKSRFSSLANIDERLRGIVERIDALSARLDAVEKKSQAQELKQDTFEHRTLGWQEGHGAGVRDALRRLDERLMKLETKEDAD